MAQNLVKSTNFLQHSHNINCAKLKQRKCLASNFILYLFLLRAFLASNYKVTTSLNSVFLLSSDSSWTWPTKSEHDCISPKGKGKGDRRIGLQLPAHSLSASLVLGVQPDTSAWGISLLRPASLTQSLSEFPKLRKLDTALGTWRRCKISNCMLPLRQICLWILLLS